VSLIGMLEQINLSSVLQRIEAHEKTGLLIIRQSAKWVELYVRDGRLMCIGPVRTNATLAERLLQDGVISPHVFQEAMRTIGIASPGESQIALFLLDRGFVGHEALRSWATGKALEVLQTLLSWSYGEIYFDEAMTPSADRLLVAMSISSLLAALPVPPQLVYETSPVGQASMQKSPVMPQIPTTPVPDMARVATSMESAQFLAGNTPSAPSLAASPDWKGAQAIPSPAAPSYIDASQLLMESLPTAFPFGDTPAPGAGSISGGDLVGASLPGFSGGSPNGYDLSARDDLRPAASPGASPSPLSISQPVPVVAPLPPKYVDTSYMQPYMVLMPSDLSAWREQNPPVQLTPDQWRLLSRVDGQTTLQAACHELAMPPEVICRIAGELVVDGLVQLGAPAQQPMPAPEVSPAPGEMAQPDVYNGYAPPSYVAPLPASDILPQYSAFMSFETESQWGNGGNGATFVPGHGWIASPQPLQPLQSSGPLASYTGSYARVDQQTR